MADLIYTIDNQGDVIFAVGPNKKKLRVSSVMLSRASPVFKALLGPHFREGQPERSSSQPVEINLPDDDPTAMIRLLELVHLKGVDTLIKGAGGSYSRRLLDFAIVTDKYDLVKTLRLQAYGMLSSWLNKLPQENNITSQGHIVAASYILSQPGLFMEITRRFMRAMHPASSALLKETSGQRIPMAVLLALQERRAVGAAQGLCLKCVQGDGDVYAVCNKSEHLKQD